MTKHLCILPWIHIEAVETGYARPCCKAEGYITKDDGVPYHLQSSDLDEIWHSNFMSKLRQDFIDGKKPEVCKKCWDEEVGGVKSKRHFSNEKFPQFLNRVHEQLQSPVYFDLKLGNICNLKCRTCCSASSTKWATEESELYPHQKELANRNLKLGRWSTENSKFWNTMDKFSNNALFFDFTGGEPFLIKEHFQLLQKLIETGRSHQISIHYNSNGTIYPSFAAENIWPHFKHVELMLSLDATEERFEYIRHPAKWSEVEENVKRFAKLECVDLSICHSISSLNVIYIPEFHDWSVENDLSFWLNIIHGPPHYNIRSFSSKAKSDIEKKLRSHSYIPKIQHEVEALIGFMNAEQLEVYDSLLNYTKRHDLYRNESMATTMPELWRLIEE